MQQNQFSEGSFQQYKPISKNNKNQKNQPPDFTTKATRKRTKNPEVSRREEIRKIRAEINEGNNSKDQ